MTTVVLKIASRGDLILCAPAFQHLRESRAGGGLVLIVGESCRDVADHLPYFDSIHTIDDRALFGRSAVGKLRVIAKILTILRQEARRGGGARKAEAVILHRDWRYAVLVWLARFGTRRGFSGTVADRLLTHTHQAEPREHHEDQYLGVAGATTTTRPVSQPFWHFSPGEREQALEKVRSLGLNPDAKPLVALGFGGGRNVKMSVDLKLWPVESYSELGRRLEEMGFGVVWLGDAYDARQLSPDVVGVNLAGRLSVPESAAVVGECRLVIANDSLLLHLARALDVPALGLFGPTDPAHTAPRMAGSGHVWLGPDVVPCSPCHQDGHYPPCQFQHRCMREMSVHKVLQTAMPLLQTDDPSLLEAGPGSEEPSTPAAAAALDRSVGVR